MDKTPTKDELNALLHEHLFGKCVHDVVDAGFFFACNKCHATHLNEEWSPPNYLTGNGMLEVITAMREKIGFRYSLKVFDSGVLAEFYRYEEDGSTTAFSEYGETVNDAPTATAIAALRGLKVL